MKKLVLILLLLISVVFLFGCDASDIGASIIGEKGEAGETPYIGENGNWWIGEVDLGVSASGAAGEKGDKGEAGENGKTPYIGENGNWWIGDTDTEVLAEHTHEYGEEEPGIAATCTSIGYTTQACTRCADIKYNFVSATGHANDSGVVYRRPTQTETGLMMYVCSACGATTMEEIDNTVVNIEGTIYQADTDYDSTNDQILNGVVVTLTNGADEWQCITDENGMYSFEVYGGVYTITFEIYGYNRVEIEIDTYSVDITVLEKIYMDIEQSSTIQGTVLKADADLVNSNNEVLGGARVQLTKTSGTNEIDLEVYTDAYGEYAFENLPAGIYKLTVSSDGYITAEQYVNVEIGQTVVQNMALEIIEDVPETQPGAVSGKIIDAAQNGEVGISGLTLQVREGINSVNGQIVLTVTTGTDGVYTITDIPAGNYTVIIIDERVLDDEALRYTTSYFNIKIVANIIIDSQNGSVSNNAQLVDSIQVKLSWGATPYDLDSHLTGPAASNNRFHVFYSQKSRENSNLDRDDTDSYGPETTTIDLSAGEDGIYRYSVHNYSNRGSSSSNAMASSGAQVEVYMGGVLKYTFYVPDEYGTLWTVFEYDSNTGVLTAINSMSYESSPFSVQ